MSRRFTRSNNWLVFIGKFKHSSQHGDFGICGIIQLLTNGSHFGEHCSLSVEIQLGLLLQSIIQERGSKMKYEITLFNGTVIYCDVAKHYPHTIYCTGFATKTMNDKIEYIEIPNSSVLMMQVNKDVVDG